MNAASAPAEGSALTAAISAAMPKLHATFCRGSNADVIQSVVLCLQPYTEGGTLAHVASNPRRLMTPDAGRYESRSRC